MKAYYNNKPSVLEAVGNGSYRYRWQIEEVEAPTMPDEEPRTQWMCNEVIVWMPLSSNKITETVISEVWPSNYEQKLVNEYNAALLGMYDEDKTSAKKEAYKAFLVERDTLKAQIDADCVELGIQ